MNWLRRPSPGFTNDVFMKRYYPQLAQRQETFRTLFLGLEKLFLPFYTIVETGTARKSPPDFAGDGAATYMFDDFVNYYDGLVITCDISSEYCEDVRQHVSTKTDVRCGNSLEVLLTIAAPVHCLYLDSLDVDWYHPTLAAVHAHKEFELMHNNIAPGGLVVFDDSPVSRRHLPKGIQKRETPWPTGKGAIAVNEIQKNPAFELVQHKYQCIFRRIR